MASRVTIAIIFICSLAVKVTGQSQPPNIKPVVVIAHRGASAERPECTLAAIKRAAQVGADFVELDVRTSRDGKLFILHDRTLDRTTNGSGVANQYTLAELKSLDAGTWFDPRYRDQRIPDLIEAIEFCRGRLGMLLDLKEQGESYDRQVAELIRRHGKPKQTMLGVRNVDQAKRFRELLPESAQLALIPTPTQIEAFAAAGVDAIRLWPRWLTENARLVDRVRATGCGLHLNGTDGNLPETRALMQHQPISILTDDPGQLRSALRQIAEE